MLIKRLLSAVLFLLLLLSLISCQSGEIAAFDTAIAFRDRYCPSGRVYSSFAGEGDEGYISEQLVSDLFLGADELPGEWALMLHSRLDSVSELGIFIADGASQRMKFTELCEERIGLLSRFHRDGEGFVFRRGSAVAYGFFDDGESARRVLESLMP